MSAFIVDYKTIDNILSIVLNPDILSCCYLNSKIQTLFEPDKRNDYYIYNNLEKLGKEFLELNIKSVKHCYPNKKDLKMNYAKKYEFKSVNKINLMQALKSLDCLMYQSCEQEDYKQNPTWQKMEKLKMILIDTFLYFNEDYKNAKWADAY